MKRWSVRDLTFAAALAAIYAVLTVGLPIPQYGAVQIRFAEALMLLPFLFPEATPGLVVGCAISNLFSPFPMDVIFGTGATLLACLGVQRVPHRWMALALPVVCNSLIVGGEIAWIQVGWTAAFWPAFGLNLLTVGLGELAACGLLGLPLLSALERIPLLRERFPYAHWDRL